MALGLRDRLRMGAGSMEEWLRDRTADLGQGLADAEAKGREVYANAIRNGQGVVARSTSELRELGRGSGPRAPAASPSSHEASRGQQMQVNARRLAAEGAAKGEALLREGVSLEGRKLAGDAGRYAGNAAGVVTGGVHMGHNLLDTAVFVGRMQNPILDYNGSLPGESASDQVLRAGQGAYDLAAKIFTDPRSVAHEVVEKARQLERDTDPQATPEVPTLSGEFRRNFHIGRRQSEIGTEIAPYLVGAGEAKGMADLRALARANSVEKYRAKGFSARKAARLARVYEGMGDHAFVRRGAQMPSWLGGGPVPDWIVESPFNVLKPPGISTGDMYELHFKVDPHMYGARLPGRGAGWSGRRLGLQKYEGPTRLWFRTPNATKRAVAIGGALGTLPEEEEQAR